MNDSNSENSKPPSGIVFVILQRSAVLMLYLLAWASAAFLCGPVMQELLGIAQYSARTPESELSVWESFNRFAAMYWFTSLLIVAVPFNLLTWLFLRFSGSRATRWKWLLVSCLWIPISLVIGWILFRSSTFPA